MNFPLRSRSEEATVAIALTPNNNKGNVNYFGMMNFVDDESFCERCGYIDCICELYRYSPKFYQ